MPVGVGEVVRLEAGAVVGVLVDLQMLLDENFFVSNGVRKTIEAFLIKAAIVGLLVLGARRPVL